MIFVTIGTQAPFDRFIKAVDLIVAEFDEEVIAQTFHGKYHPKNMKTIDFLPPDEFNRIFAKARLIVAHAGMGTILSALVQSKPIIVMPRIAALGEHTNEHQLATANKMKKLGYIYVANNENELENLILDTKLQPLYKANDIASLKLIGSIKNFILYGK